MARTRLILTSLNYIVVERLPESLYYINKESKLGPRPHPVIITWASIAKVCTHRNT